MAYATLTDLTARAGTEEILQVADRDASGAADPAVIDAALAAADRQIDAALGVRFALPLDPVPGIVRDWAVAIARYLLHRDGPPDYVVRDHTLALAALRDAAAGRLALPDLAGLAAAPAPVAGGTAAAGGREAIFTDASLEGFR
jgi:phage gp36-like protein